MTIIIGVDTGGTFTDFIYKKNEKWCVYKILSTPSNPAEAVLKGLEKILKGKTANITHGSTVATNTILERKGVITAIITNKGFEDLIEIGRQNRTNLYDLQYKKTPSLVPSPLRFGIKCRVDANGDIIKDIDEEELKSICQKLKKLKVESVAICFLFSFLNNKHELYVKDYLEKKGINCCISSEILPEFREYERLSTTVINAYVSPKMHLYMNHIKKSLPHSSKLRIMQSNGGVISTEVAMKEPVRTILSGPAGGVVGAFKIGKMVGFDKLITFDMGGTSTDVSLIDRELSLTVESEINGFPVRIPMINIHTVGAGGGSIAYVDEGGALRVGPVSAGADPGPICYGKGEELTVTDANLYLGRLVPEYFLGGNIRLHKERVKHFLQKKAKKIGISPLELAEGIIDVANSNMERAIRVISVEKGFDPSEFVLFSFGGAGGMHAVFLAKLLHIPTVLVPKNPGILSAIGMLLSDIIKDYSLTVMLKKDISYKKLKSMFSPLIKKGKKDLEEEGVIKESIHFECYIDMRYKGQSYEIMVLFDEDYQKNFHKLHQKLYGYSDPEKPIELVNLRVRAFGKLDKPKLEKETKPTKKISEKAIFQEKDVFFFGKKFSTQIYLRELLRYGNTINGPAIVVEYSSTTVIPPQSKAKVDEYGNLIISSF